MKKLIIGLDIHGVIDSDIQLFSKLTSVFKMNGAEIHLLTGVEITDRLLKFLAESRITFDNIFSITSYHKSIGTFISYKNGDPDHPLIAPPKWNRTKADYCRRWGVCIYLDDSTVYGKYFDTDESQYILYTPTIHLILKSLLAKGT